MSEESRVNVKIEIDLEIVKKEPECEEQTVIIKKEPVEVKEEQNNVLDIEIVIKPEPQDDCGEDSNLNEHGANTGTAAPDTIIHEPSHQESHANKCQICQDTFSHATLLFAHNCTPKKDITSYLENNIHKHILNLHRSQFSHTFGCDTCKIQFDNEIKLNAHFAEVHTSGNEDKQLYFQCKKCQIRFQSKSHLTEHETTHEVKRRRRRRAEPKPHICEVCKKVFILKASLKRHMRIHAPTQSFSCDICQKEMAYKSSLIKHMQLHMTQKKYPCDICQKRFAQPSTMKAHRRIHTGEKPHACDQCEMRFTDKSNLKKHKLIHMDVKPHSCGVCEKQFTDRRSLVGHMRSHTGEKPYFCETCNTRFAYACALTKHIRNNRCEKYKSNGT